MENDWPTAEEIALRAGVSVRQLERWQKRDWIARPMRQFPGRGGSTPGVYPPSTVAQAQAVQRLVTRMKEIGVSADSHAIRLLLWLDGFDIRRDALGESFGAMLRDFGASPEASNITEQVEDAFVHFLDSPTFRRSPYWRFLRRQGIRLQRQDYASATLDLLHLTAGDEQDFAAISYGDRASGNLVDPADLIAQFAEAESGLARYFGDRKRRLAGTHITAMAELGAFDVRNVIDALRLADDEELDYARVRINVFPQVPVHPIGRALKVVRGEENPDRGFSSVVAYMYVRYVPSMIGRILHMKRLGCIWELD